MRTYLAMYSLGFVAACAAEPARGPVALAAADDQLAIEMDTSGELAVLDNDVGVAAARVVTLVDAPAHGTATLDDAGVLHYQPASEYIGADVVHYQIENPDATLATAAIAIEVHCATCALGTDIHLAWDPNAPAEMVTGYRVFLGPTVDPTSLVMIDDIAIDRPGFDATMPAIAYDAWTDLHLRLGDMACFRLKAYNAAGESDFSNGACATVTRTSMRLGL